ncbi:hypothetical protein D9619_007910 [Psilocybe cf. subviscida]|uniref:Aminoglycoside phosphotransferase domain-containing protein n=1 Tax=Psilocybe cf. subviscida TaxID=2480587 RepID=A0A8H5ATF6_9AGAR|nr:hypothetical protein D9619_007910 [Psilocybe cf. subviscida]
MGQLLSLMLSAEKPHDTEKKSSVDSLTNEEIAALVEGIRDEDAIGFRGDPNNFFRRDSLVHPISHDTVVKFMYGAEPFMMAYISSHTSIPIPRIRRVLRQPLHNFDPYSPGYTPVVIDRIDGEPLETAWPTMGGGPSIPIPCPDKPGPFDTLGRRYFSKGYFFTRSGAPPCESYKEMADWFDCRRFDAMVVYHKRTGKILACPKFDRKQPFVVCYGNIKPANTIVDWKGIPWLIDFGESGVYPIWYEYAKALLQFTPYTPPSALPLWLWRWAAFGSYGQYVYNYLYSMDDVGIWDGNPHDWSLDYFTEHGLDVD